MNYLIVIVVIVLAIGGFIARLRTIYSQIQTVEYLTYEQKTFLFAQLALFVIWGGLLILTLIHSPFQLTQEWAWLISGIILATVSLSCLINRVSIAEFIVWPHRGKENKILTEIRATNVGILGLLIALVLGFTGVVLIYWS